MDKFRSELKSVRHFDAAYYDELLDTINRYVSEKPDISIETCKSLFEGMSKLILMELEQTPESYFKNNDLTLARLFSITIFKTLCTKIQLWITTVAFQ